MRRAFAFASLGGIAVALFATAMQAGAQGLYRLAVVAGGLGLIGVWFLGRRSAKESVAIAVAHAVAVATASAKSEATAQALSQVQVFIDTQRAQSREHLVIDGAHQDMLDLEREEAGLLGPAPVPVVPPLWVPRRRTRINQGADVPAEY